MYHCDAFIYHSKYCNINDKKFMNILDEGMYQDDDGFYVTPLPLKDGVNKLANNKPAAFQRLNGLKKKFIKNPGLHDLYSKGIKESVEFGLA